MSSGLFSLPLAPAVASEPAAYTLPRQASIGLQERFIAGPENALVRALVEAAIADPPPYNPIVLCGPAGVGKTSLAHSLAALRRERLCLPNVIAVTGTDLARSLAHALETDSVADLRTRHHRCDVLLIDEVHRLAAKPAAQQFLLTALDSLLRRGTLVIATVHRPPLTTDGLMPTLASRLAGGLVVNVAAPSRSARRELVRQAAARVNLSLSDDVVARLIGSDDTPRHLITAGHLRHAVLQLAANPQHRPIQARDIADLLEGESPDTKALCRRVAAAVARHFGLSTGQLRGKSRQQSIVEARSLAVYLVRRLTAASYAEIGQHFGGRDHSTILHACRKITAQINSDDATSRLADELANQMIESQSH